MDSPLAIAKYFIPQIPSLAYTSAQHSLGLSANSSKWDLRTELFVHVVRHYMTGKGRGPSQISKVQALTLGDAGVKGKIWVAKATIPKPAPGDENIEDTVMKVIEDMKPGEIRVTRAGLVDIEVEWTGSRPSAGNGEGLPDISEADKYQRLLAEPSRTSDVTILYFHGGAYYHLDPVTHRPICGKLAKESKGVVCNVRYRLAPETAFPGQLLDAFLVYLSLLYPPPGSLHAAIPAEHIVLGGDSAGGNLAFALLQLILQLHRSAATTTPPNSAPPTVRFHGRDVPVPLPAGVSANSGWFDIARGMPSNERNAANDYLPAPHASDVTTRFAPDHIWPADPPRGDLFCDLSLLDHPLVTLAVADSWAGAPPLWLCTGEEMLTDEDLAVASRAARQGVPVHFEQYEAMPHCFALLLAHLPTARRCVASWGAWAQRCVEAPAALRTNGTYIRAKSGKEVAVAVAEVASLSDEEVRRYVVEAKEWRLREFGQEKMIAM